MSGTERELVEAIKTRHGDTGPDPAWKITLLFMAGVAPIATALWMLWR